MLIMKIRIFFKKTCSDSPINSEELQKYKFSTPHYDDTKNKEIEILKYAIDNKEVKNIAIQGEYGSGKTSLIKSFEKQYGYLNEYKILDISLATFGNTDNKIETIEKIILEQIFYRVEKSKIPLSKFKRISEVSFREALINFTSFFLLIFSYFFIFDETFKNLLKSNFDISNYNNFIVCTLFIDFLILFFYFYKMLLIIKNSTINKITSKDIEISQIDEKSLLNKYLDEILYFFKKNKFRIVVFQDLDRFDKIDIFTRLRQLNYFLNNYEGIKHKITFLYAIKPSILKNTEERTKFFDFILIKIPYINSHNSKEKIIKYFEKDNILIDEDLLKYVSLYMHNIRIINNIYNEFLFYKDKLNINRNDKLKNTKLFALLVCKFFNTEEFSKLEKSEGNLHNILKSKNDYIKTKKSELASYIAKSYAEELFNLARYGRIYIDQNNNSGYSKQDIENNYELVSKLVNSCKIFDTYSEIDVKDVNKKYQKKIKSLNTLSNSPLKDFYKYIDFKNIEQYKYADMIKYFIEQGYIDEDYDQYISNFTYDDLTDNDKKFVLNLKHKKENLGFDYKLSNVDKVLDHLKSDDFTCDFILNIQLFLHLIKNYKNYNQQFSNFCKFLQDTNPLEFYKNLLDENCKDVINCLIENINDFWSIVEKIENKEKYLKNIIKMASKANLNEIFKSKNMQIYFSNISSLSFIDPNDENTSKNIIDIIEKFKIKFKKLNDIKIHHVLYNHIIENNSYEINIDNFKTLFAEREENKNKFNEKNYTFFKELKNNKPFNYIKENLNEYIKNVFLKLEYNTKESEEIVIELINNNIDEVLKKEIIKKQECKFYSLNDVNKNLQIFIIEQNKLICTIENIKYLLNLGYNFNLIVKYLIQNENNIEQNILKECCELLLNKNKNKELIDFVYKKFKDKEKLNSSTIKQVIQNNNEIDKKITFLYKQIDNLKTQDILDILNNLGGEYKKIALQDGKHVKIEIKEYNYKLLEKLKEKHFITSYKKEKNYYRTIVKYNE